MILHKSFTEILLNERFEIRLCQPKGRDLVLDMFPTSSLAHIPPDCSESDFFALSPSFKAI